MQLQFSLFSNTNYAQLESMGPKNTVFRHRTMRRGSRADAPCARVIITNIGEPKAFGAPPVPVRSLFSIVLYRAASALARAGPVILACRRVDDVVEDIQPIESQLSRPPAVLDISENEYSSAEPVTEEGSTMEPGALPSSHWVSLSSIEINPPSGETWFTSASQMPLEFLSLKLNPEMLAGK